MRVVQAEGVAGRAVARHRHPHVAGAALTIRELWGGVMVLDGRAGVAVGAVGRVCNRRSGCDHRGRGGRRCRRGIDRRSGERNCN